MKKYIGTLMVLGVLFVGAPSVFALATQDAPVLACSSTTAPWIRVLSPNGGETYTPGQQITVTWTSCNVSASATVNIELDQPAINSSGASLVDTLNDGSELVNLPTTATFPGMIYGKNFKMKLQKIGTGIGAYDYSDNLFTIKIDNSEIISPTITQVSRNSTIAPASVQILSTQTDVKKVQSILISQGFLNGKADGKIGSVTVKAIKDYQKANSLPVTGNMDTVLLNLMTTKATTAVSTPKQVPSPISITNYQRLSVPILANNGVGGPGPNLITTASCLNGKKILSGGPELSFKNGYSGTNPPQVSVLNNFANSDNSWTVSIWDPQMQLISDSNQANTSKLWIICAN